MYLIYFYISRNTLQSGLNSIISNHLLQNNYTYTIKRLKINVFINLYLQGRGTIVVLRIRMFRIKLNQRLNWHFEGSNIKFIF